MAKILGIGNALVDIMTRLDHDDHLEIFRLPKGSMTLADEVLVEKVSRGTLHLEKVQSSGGSAANTITGLAKLGIKTAFMGKVGRDEVGNFFHEDLVRNKINPILYFSENPSGQAIALVSPDFERTFATYLGAAVELSAGDLQTGDFKGYDFFHIEGYLVQNHALIEKALQLAKENELKVSLDLASYNVVEENLDFLKRMVKDYVDILFANEEEARAFTGKTPEEALEEMAGMVEIAVVKTGRKGSLIKKGKNTFRIGIIEVKPLDTTGAGDLYASGFLYGLSRGYPLDRCGKTGAVLGGRVIEVMGAKMDDSRWEQILREIKNI
ncbi:MAG: adenosine kinase [Bacteroidota bacterium]|nr:adenosine kinase [Bacteroidota bacterium]